MKNFELLNNFLFAEQQRGGQRVALGTSRRVSAPETGFDEHRFVGKPQPRVTGIDRPNPTAGLGEDGRVEVGEFEVRIDDVLGAIAAFAVDDLGDANRFLDAEIAVVPAIIDHAAAPVDLGTGRDLQDEDVFAFDFDCRGSKDEGRIEFLGVVGEVDDLGGEGLDGAWFDAHDIAPVVHAEHDDAAVAVQEGADGLEEAAGQGLTGLFELDGAALLAGEPLFDLFGCHAFRPVHPFAARLRQSARH